MTKNTSLICPPIIGLAGGIGSGKSTVTTYFNKLGIESVDADDVARSVVEPGSKCLHNIQQRYGSTILLEDGSLNRKALRKIIFDDVNERNWLESLTHPEIKKQIQQQLNSITSSYALLVHPLLFEKQQNTLCQLVIAIDVPKSIQIDRIIRRDKTTKEQAEKIITTQFTNDERLKQADLQLKNTGNINNMDAKVLKLHHRILELLAL